VLDHVEKHSILTRSDDSIRSDDAPVKA